MIFLTPMVAGLAAGVAVPALVALYFLKLRRREVAVSSTLLWKRAIKDMEVNSPFQKIKKNWLLLLQILTLLALLIALARPVLDGGSVSGRRVVIVVDRSASMNATDVSPTRLGEAQKVAGEVAEAAVRGGGVLGWLGWGGSTSTSSGISVSGASGVMVVSFGGGSGAQVVEPFTNDPTLLRNAIEAIEPSDGSGGLATALGLVEPYARDAAIRGGDPLIVYVVSDGRVGELGSALSGADVRYVKVGTVGAKNVGITAVSARRDYRRPERVRLFVRLVNSTPATVQGNLTVRVDGQVTKVSAFAVPAATELKEPTSAEVAAMVTMEEPTGTQPGAGGALGKKAEPAAGPSTDGLAAISMEFELTMPSGGLVEVSHDVVDALTADNRAALWVGKPRQLGVMVVTEGNAFLMQAIKAMGPGMMRAMKPQEYEAKGADLLRNSAVADESQRFDVAVFDRYSPAALPATPALYLGGCPPVPGVAMVAIGGAADKATTQTATTKPKSGGLSVVLDWRRDHPLLRHVNLGDLVIEGAARLTIPENGEVLAVGIHGPLMGRVMVAGKSHVMTSFSLLKSNWPLQVGFPVFVANAIEWLSVGTSGEAGVSYRPGESAVVDGSLPGLEAAISTLSDEGGGQQYIFGAPGAGSVSGKRTAGQVIFSPFEHVGLYRPRGSTKGDAAGLVLASNLANPLESDLRPAAKLTVGRGVLVAGQADKAAVRREVWRWFAWGALVLLVLEWVVWARR
jgi:hypothetical protein